MKVVTRFPPEPNFYLHLGHAKAMHINFTYHKDCECILRMDDTNPKTERQEYVDSIIEDVSWLGYKPCKITYTSDYFDVLYKYAIDLINMGCAYVDFSTSSEIKSMRKEGIESKYRNSSIKDNLTEFHNMFSGIYKENDAVLRLKIDMKSENHCMRDPIAYRIILTPHYKTGEKWKIYPSYDYSHGIVDSLEGITHSYCSIEFLIRRDLYMWPLSKLSLKPAVVQEFGRLNVENNILSKRKIKDYVSRGLVTGYDDPRLLTIRALRKKGYSSEIINNIICHSSIDRNDTNINNSLIEYHLREILDKKSPRYFAVLNPYKTYISDNDEIVCSQPNNPKDLSLGTHELLLGKNIYIERSDFRETDEKNYYRLAPNKTVRLKYGNLVNYHSHSADTLFLTKNNSNKKVKGVIHWLPVDFSIPAKLELFESLLDNGEYNPRSKNVHIGYVDKNCILDGEIIYQFERIGYFKFDRYEDNLPVFIRIVGLVNKYD